MEQNSRSRCSKKAKKKRDDFQKQSYAVTRIAERVSHILKKPMGRRS
jgi:hypothetical protein